NAAPPVDVPPGAALLKVAAEMRDRYQLEVAPLAPAERSASLETFGEVVDPGPLLRTWRDWQTALVQAENAAREAERNRKLAAAGQLASAQVVDSSEAQARVAAAQAETAEDQLRFDWGALLDDGG